MEKYLIELDEEVLELARAELGTGTLNDTVNEALRLASGDRARRAAAALERLARALLEDRAEAWR